MPDTNDIDALLRALDPKRFGGIIHTADKKRHHAALTALVAERDALKQRVAELEKTAFYIPPKHTPADRELRERLVCAALTGVWIQGWTSRDAMAAFAVGAADATLAAMRKGEQ